MALPGCARVVRGGAEQETRPLHTQGASYHVPKSLNSDFFHFRCFLVSTNLLLNNYHEYALSTFLVPDARLIC